MTATPTSTPTSRGASPSVSAETIGSESVQVSTWSPLAAGAVSGALAAVASLAVVGALVVGAWILAPHAGDDSVPLATGALVWLAAHGVEVTATGLLVDTTLRFAPLGGLLLLGVIPAVAARRAARASWCSGTSDWLRVSAAVAVGYVAVGAVVLGRASQPEKAVADARGLIAVAALALLAAALGSAGACSDQVRGLLPPQLRLPARAAVAATAVLLCGAALMVAVGLLLSVGEVAEVLAGVGGSALGIASLGVLSALALPTAIVWAVAVAAGPGIGLGPDAGVTAVAVDLPSLPAFPLLAAMPPTGSAPPALLLLLLPVAAGVVAGIVIHRRRPSGDEPGRLIAGLLTGLLTGLMIGLAAWWSQISVGSTQPLTLGPSPLPVALSLAVIVGGTAAVVAWEGGRLSSDGVRERVMTTVRSLRGRLPHR